MTTAIKKGYCPKQAMSKREIEARKIVHGMIGWSAMLYAIVSIKSGG